MSDPLRDEIARALVCLEFVNEDEGHDADTCIWCELSDYSRAFDGDAGIEKAAALLRRAVTALDAPTTNSANASSKLVVPDELRDIKGRATALVSALSAVTPRNDFDRIAQAIARYVLTGTADVGDIVTRLFATGTTEIVEEETQR